MNKKTKQDLVIEKPIICERCGSKMLPRVIDMPITTTFDMDIEYQHSKQARLNPLRSLWCCSKCTFAMPYTRGDKNDA